MSRPLRVEFSGAFYHVMGRGNAGEDVLSGDDDKLKFLDCLERAAQRFSLCVHAYCLMDNHYHLLLETRLPLLSRSMQWLTVCYAVWYNRHHQRSGHLFQGRFKALLVDADAYLATLSRYLHRNPVRAGMVNTAQDYPWSSCRDFLAVRPSPDWLQTELILGCYGSDRAVAIPRYAAFLEEGEDGDDPHSKAKAGFIYGREIFAERVKRDYLAHREPDAEIPQLRQLNKTTPEMVVRAVLKEFNDIDETSILRKGTKSCIARVMAIGLARELCAMEGKELGTYFGGIGTAAITMAGKRLERQCRENEMTRERVLRVRRMILNF